MSPMPLFHPGLLGWWVCLVLLACGACRPAPVSRSPLFYEVFVDDTTTFRGTMLGDSIEQVLAHEAPESPVHVDPLGISYQFRLSPGYLMLADYYSDHLKTERESKRLASIVANILINDEVETAKLYEEILTCFNARYGVSTGLYGHYKWQSSNRFTHSMEIVLRLNEDKKGITLNFIDTQPRQEAGFMPGGSTATAPLLPGPASP